MDDEAAQSPPQLPHSNITAHIPESSRVSGIKFYCNKCSKPALSQSGFACPMPTCALRQLKPDESKVVSAQNIVFAKLLQSYTNLESPEDIIADFEEI